MTELTTRALASTYIEWAKLSAGAKYNLATSGVIAFPWSELPITLRDLEINSADAYGYRPLRERLARKFGTDPRCVVAAAGTSMANHLAMAALLGPGDDVLIEKPAYAPLLEVASYLRANILRFNRLAENRFQVDLEDLRQKITLRTRLIALTNLHNPSGAFLDEKTLQEIGAIAAKVGAHVLVDEVYLSLSFDRPIRSSFHLGNHFIVTSSLTKAYGLSGLRCGWILAQPNLADKMWKLNDLFGVNAAHPAELLSVVALDNLDQIAARSKELLDTNRRALDSFLDTRNDLDVLRPPFGTVVFPRLKNTKNSALGESASASATGFCEFLRAKFETSVVPGHFFETPQNFRVGIGGDPVMTQKGLEQLGKALDAYQNSTAAAR